LVSLLIEFNESTKRYKVSSRLLVYFRSEALSPGPRLQRNAIASKKNGEVLPQKQQHQSHQGGTAMQLSSIHF